MIKYDEIMSAKPSEALKALNYVKYHPLYDGNMRLIKSALLRAEAVEKELAELKTLQTPKTLVWLSEHEGKCPKCSSVQGLITWRDKDTDSITEIEPRGRFCYICGQALCKGSE